MTPSVQTLPAGDVIRRRVMQERWDGGHRALHEYRRRVEAAISPGMAILHAGCGWDKHRITEPHGADCTVVGVDLDPRVGPMFHGGFLLADLADLPLGDDRFDLIVSEYVLEHVQDPVKTFREFARVLRPGGRAILLTPNLYSYKTLAARLTSHRVHEAAGRMRYGPGQEEEMYPTVFRCNTSARMRSVARQTGLEIDSLTFVTNGPTWFQRLPVLFEMGHLYHRAIDRWSFAEQLRCAVIVELTKPELEIRTSIGPASNRPSS